MKEYRIYDGWLWGWPEDQESYAEEFDVWQKIVPVDQIQGLTEQFGLRYQNLQDEPVYIATDGKESALKAKAPGDVLVSRYITDWEPEPEPGPKKFASGGYNHTRETSRGFLYGFPPPGDDSIDPYIPRTWRYHD